MQWFCKMQWQQHQWQQCAASEWFAQGHHTLRAVQFWPGGNSNSGDGGRDERTVIEDQGGTGRRFVDYATKTKKYSSKATLDDIAMELTQCIERAILFFDDHGTD